VPGKIVSTCGANNAAISGCATRVDINKPQPGGQDHNRSGRPLALGQITLLPFEGYGEQGHRIKVSQTVIHVIASAT